MAAIEARLSNSSHGRRAQIISAELVCLFYDFSLLYRTVFEPGIRKMFESQSCTVNLHCAIVQPRLFKGGQGIEKTCES